MVPYPMVNISYIQVDWACEYVPYFEYVPSRGNGSSCSCIEDGMCYTGLSKEMFEECVESGLALANKYHATLWENTDCWLKDDSSSRFEEILY